MGSCTHPPRLCDVSCTTDVGAVESTAVSVGTKQAGPGWPPGGRVDKTPTTALLFRRRTTWPEKGGTEHAQAPEGPAASTRRRTVPTKVLLVVEIGRFPGRYDRARAGQRAGVFCRYYGGRHS